MILYTEQEIQDRIKKISSHINHVEYHYPDIPVFICVLNGAFMFFTDLVKEIGECEIDFVQAKSYDNQKQGEIYIHKTITSNIEGKHIYLVDDIYDSGNTMNRLIKHLNYQKPKSITPVTLFKKQHSECSNLIYGFELKDETFLVGYGLDSVNGTKRNQKYIEGVSPE